MTERLIPITKLRRFDEIKVEEPKGWASVIYAVEAFGHKARYGPSGWAWMIQFRMIEGDGIGRVLNVLADPALKAIGR